MRLAYNLNHPSPFVLTKLSSILMRASNSCSPTCHLGWVEDPSPAGSGTCGRDLYFPGSNITRLSGPPALASVRTYKILRGVYKQTKPSKDPESRNKTKKRERENEDTSTSRKRHRHPTQGQMNMYKETKRQRTKALVVKNAYKHV